MKAFLKSLNIEFIISMLFNIALWGFVLYCLLRG
jgi:hypothetical protein